MGTVYPLGVGVAGEMEGSVYQRRHIGLTIRKKRSLFGLVLLQVVCIFVQPRRTAGVRAAEGLPAAFRQWCTTDVREGWAAEWICTAESLFPLWPYGKREPNQPQWSRGWLLFRYKVQRQVKDLARRGHDGK